ncbi:polysaccharide deacetylase family protein [Heliobacterium gestii]|uniref:Polysaccharide deacetylase family protein n=1 Tax=Heliomicrobium gestii TaxID=2699 RepID=A0A845L9B3_HELGE|nr:polysaccharide deacetylase family protein [Heliomicrobium gestii]MBM7866487.1 poly-beta-1,6-N-acetyl-D-glucosamine N-deacetylase PgaB [Heliomicrobium gestii]MZP43232.1 polysaccharide deacetylase family protein [Heliomicrobium gestii]
MTLSLKRKRMGLAAFVVVLLLLAAFATGCGPTGSSSAAPPTPNSAASTDASTGANPPVSPSSTADAGAAAETPGRYHQAGEPIRILMYHHFTNRGYFKNNGVAVIIDDFAAQMEYLRREGYHVVPLQRIWDYAQKGTPLPSRPVALTFDDGYESNYTLAFPILKKYNYPFTLFPVAGWLLDENPPHTFNPAKADLLDWRQVDEMVASGLCDVQSHTFDLHDKVNGRSLLIAPKVVDAKTGRKETPDEVRSRVKSDLQMAKETIENRYGRPVTTLAYPYGEYDVSVMNIMDELGYSYAVCMGRAQHKDNLKAVIRLGIVQEDGMEGFAKKMNQWAWTIKGKK